MTLSRPNTIELYESAVQNLRPVLAGIKPDQLGAPTPCQEWNVQQLLIHTIKAPQRYHSLLTGGAPVDHMDVGGPLPASGALAAYEAASEQLLGVIREPGYLDRVVVHRRFGEISVSDVIMFPFMDALIHKWDLAKATNQESSLDSSLAEVCYNYVLPEIEKYRSPRVFGTEVEVPTSASIQDKLLGLIGRQP